MMKIKNYFRSFLLLGTVEGTAPDGKAPVPAQDHGAVSGGEDAAVAPFSWAARVAPYIPTVRSVASPASCARRSARQWPSPSNPNSGMTAPAAPPVTTSTCSKCIYCGFCEESCPVDSIVETRIYEYHGEHRADQMLMTKHRLLASRRRGGTADCQGSRRGGDLPVTGRSCRNRVTIMLEQSIFYIFCGLPRSSRPRMGVISVRNPVHAALFLVSSRFFAARQSGCYWRRNSLPSPWCWSTSAR